MVLSDDDPQKWIYTEHTKFKHELLRKYLRGWIYILGGYHERICFFDCFAGRGTYITDGEETIYGSPLIALQLAKSIPDNYGKFVFVLIEKEKKNYNDLVDEFKKEGWDNKKILVDFYNEEFSTIAGQMLAYFKNEGGRLAPSFFFIDPFGFKGIPFPIVKEILSFPKTEVFFTFMTRDITRFLSSDKHEGVLNELFGDDCWKEISIKDNKEQALIELYMKKLKTIADAKFVLPFRVGADKVRSTTYYLLHISNHFKAYRLMKDIAYNQSAGRLGYFGPDDNLIPITQFLDPIPDTKKYLLNKFSGRRMSFGEVIEGSYLDEKILTHEKILRGAIKDLYKEETIKILHVGPRGGIPEHALVTFP